MHRRVDRVYLAAVQERFGLDGFQALAKFGGANVGVDLLGVCEASLGEEAVDDPLVNRGHRVG